MARHLVARGVPGAIVAQTAAALAAGQRIEPAARQQTAALTRLADLSAVSWQADGTIRWTATMTAAEALEASEAETAREDEVERSRLTMMRRYAEHTGCRRSFLLTYFGQDFPGPCGNCDNDLAPPGPARAEVPFAVGARVFSDRWGGGTVQRYDGDHLTVLFDDHGYRELFVPTVLKRGLQRPSSSAAAPPARNGRRNSQQQRQDKPAGPVLPRARPIPADNGGPARAAPSSGRLTHHDQEWPADATPSADYGSE